MAVSDVDKESNRMGQSTERCSFNLLLRVLVDVRVKTFQPILPIPERKISLGSLSSQHAGNAHLLHHIASRRAGLRRQMGQCQDL